MDHKDNTTCLHVFWAIRHAITTLNGLVDATVAILQPRESHLAKEGRYMSLSGRADQASRAQKLQRSIARIESDFVGLIQKQTHEALSQAAANDEFSPADRDRITAIVAGYGDVCEQLIREAAKAAAVATTPDSSEESERPD